MENGVYLQLVNPVHTFNKQPLPKKHTHAPQNACPVGRALHAHYVAYRPSPVGLFLRLPQIPAPDNAARLAIFSVHLDKVPLGGDVDLAFLAKITDGFTGAEVAGVCREAAFEAMRAAADEADEAEASGKANAGAGTGAGGSAEGSGGGGESSRSNSEVSLREHLGSVVIRMQHLEAAAAATVPLLSDPAKRVLYAADFSLD